MRNYTIKNFFLYVALSVGCMIALLPLIWMLIVACKQQGQALKFEFLPTKMGTTAPYRVTVGEAKPVVILEYRNPSAQSVYVKTAFNQGHEAELSGENGLFSVRFFDV